MSEVEITLQLPYEVDPAVLCEHYKIAMSTFGGADCIASYHGSFKDGSRTYQFSLYAGHKDRGSSLLLGGPAKSGLTLFAQKLRLELDQLFDPRPVEDLETKVQNPKPVDAVR